MPEGGAEHRAEQQALVARLLHRQATDPRLGDLLAEAEARLGSPRASGDPVAVNLRELRDEYEKARLVPASLVEDLARVTTLSYEALRTARERRDARVFLPWLDRVVTLKQAEADCVARGRDRYDALLDEWEPGLTWATLEPMLARLRAAVGPLLDRAIERSGPRPAFLARPVDVRLQGEIARELAEWLGFDFASGRLDEATNPSTIRVGPGDVRLTTRFRRTAFAAGLFATLHELGHGLYEQFLPREHFGAPVGEAPSLGIHESQARLVENHLGRSRAFWQHLWPRLAPRFGAAFEGVTADDVVAGRQPSAPGRGPDSRRRAELRPAHPRPRRSRAGARARRPRRRRSARGVGRGLPPTPRRHPAQRSRRLPPGQPLGRGHDRVLPDLHHRQRHRGAAMQQLRGRGARARRRPRRGRSRSRSSPSCAIGSIASAASSPPRRWSSAPPAHRCRSTR